MLGLSALFADLVDFDDPLNSAAAEHFRRDPVCPLTAPINLGHSVWEFPERLQSQGQGVHQKVLRMTTAISFSPVTFVRNLLYLMLINLLCFTIFLDQYSVTRVYSVTRSINFQTSHSSGPRSRDAAAPGL